MLQLGAYAARTLRGFWKTAVPDMIDNLKLSHALLLIEFLVALPDQVSRTDRSDISSERKGDFQDEFQEEFSGERSPMHDGVSE